MKVYTKQDFILTGLVSRYINKLNLDNACMKDGNRSRYFLGIVNDAGLLIGDSYFDGRESFFVDWFGNIHEVIFGTPQEEIENNVLLMDAVNDLGGSE